MTPDISSTETGMLFAPLEKFKSEQFSVNKEQLKTFNDKVQSVTPLNNHELLQNIEQFFPGIYEQNPGVWEGLTLGQHTLSVLNNFDTYFPEENGLPWRINRNNIKLILALHDIGKPEAFEKGNKSLQYSITHNKIERLFQEIGIDEQNTRLALALTSGDPLGQYISGKINSKESCKQILEMANIAWMPPSIFFDVLTIYYRVDAASYTERAGSVKSLDALFEFDDIKKELRFSKIIKGKVDALKARVNNKNKLVFPVIHSEKFKKFFEASKITDSDGLPKVVFHGSTIEFDEFGSLDEIADSSGHMGAAFYFTDSVKDVNSNYARVGPDRGRRIDLEANIIRRTIRDDFQPYIGKVAALYRITHEEATKKLEIAVKKAQGSRWVYKDDLYQIATSIIEQQLRQNEGIVYPAYLRIQNPIYLSRDDKGTMFNEQSIAQFRNQIPAISDKYKIDQKALESDFDKQIKKKKYPISVWEIVHRLTNTDTWRSTKNPKNGRDMYGQIIADILQNMGYDGAIVNAFHAFGPRGDLFDRTIGWIFGNRGMKGVKGAAHYVVWKPDQIMSVYS